MKAILESSQTSPIAGLARKYGRNVSWYPGYIESIIEKTEKYPTGARALYSCVQKDIDEALFDAETDDSPIFLGEPPKEGSPEEKSNEKAG
jgi:hypothetical protein